MESRSCNQSLPRELSPSIKHTSPARRTQTRWGTVWRSRLRLALQATRGLLVTPHRLCEASVGRGGMAAGALVVALLASHALRSGQPRGTSGFGNVACSADLQVGRQG